MAERGAPLGNDNGAKGREWRTALRRALAHRAEDGNYRTTLLKIATNVVLKAEEGDYAAWQEIAQREDGKPTQPISGDDERPPASAVILPTDAGL